MSAKILPEDAIKAIDALSRSERLMVGTDFDGTMSPIVEIPADARPLPKTVTAVRQLAELPNTHVAIISGRSLEVLGELTGLEGAVQLVGSHGMEFDAVFQAALTDQERDRLAEINRKADLVAMRYPGMQVEPKPASTAIHYRHVADDQRDRAVADIEAGPCAVDGAHVITGKMVVEIAALYVSKGSAMDRLRAQHDATAVVFVGDDITDEGAFERLSPPDVGVKVGPGRTAATVRIDDPAAVADFLLELATRRRVWLNS